MHKGFLIVASFISALAVILGAFGAHELKKHVTITSLTTFETGVRYQFYHCFALFMVAILFERFPGKPMLWAGYSFIIGIILFSGSLYILTALQSTEQVGLRKIGILTPIGGLFFIAGWVLLATAIIKSK